MPWHPIDLPSLQVGLLHTLVSRTRPGDEVREFHGSLRWAEFLLKHSGGRIRPGDYVRVAELSDVQREAVALLAEEGLARVTDGQAVVLPPRIRRWPVPCTGI